MPGSMPAAQFFGGGQSGAPMPPQAPQVPQQQPNPTSAALPQVQMPQGQPAGSGTPQPSAQPSFSQSNQPISAQDFWSGNYQGAPAAPTPATQPTPVGQMSVGGFLGNAVNSLGSTLGNIGSAILHPINTIKNLSVTAAGGAEEASNALLGTKFNNMGTDAWNNIVGYYQKKYGSPQNFLSTLYNDPAGVALDASVLLDGIGGAVGAAGEAGEAGDIADAAKAGSAIPLGGTTAEGEAVAPGAIQGTASNMAARAGSAISKVGEAINPLNVVTKPISALIDSGLPAIAKGAVSQFTGIQPADIERIMANPDEFTKDSIGNFDRSATAEKVNNALQGMIDEKTETGAGYDAIRAQGTQIPVTSDYLTKLISDKSGLTVTGGGTAEYPYELEAGPDTKLSPADASKLQRNILDKWNPQFAKGELSSSQFLNLRNDLSKVANFEGVGKSADLDAVAKQMYGQLNDDFRSQIPGLAEKDATYAQQASDLKELRAGILNKDGTMKETAINKIANATGKGKDAFAARLEKISPGITDEIANGVTKEHLQALQGNVVGTYGKAAGLAGSVFAGSSLGGPLGAAAGFLIDQFISNPDRAVPVLRVLGKASPIYQAILDHFNVSTPGQIAAAAGRMSKASQTPARRVINIKR